MTDRRRRRRWRPILAAGLVLAGLAASWLVPRMQEPVPKHVYWRVALGFLVALEIAYCATVVAVLVAIPVLVAALRQARRQRTPVAGPARGLLLCISLVIGLALGEVYAGIRQAHAPRGASVPGRSGKPARQARELRRLFETGAVALPDMFPDRDSDGAINLVVVGESSAEGVPYNFWLSIGKIVSWQLQETLPSRRVRLEVLAISGDTLERQHWKLSRVRHRPDALIVYCGHNEFSARFRWSRDIPHYVDQHSAWFGDVAIKRVEQTSPLCGLIGQTAEKCRVALPPPPEAGRALIDVPEFTPAEYNALLADFERRLEQIVAYAERVGAVPILIVPAANDADFEPNRSFLPAKTPHAERAAVAREFHAIREQERGDVSGAIERYRSLLARQPGFAEAHYRLGRLLQSTGAWDEAYQHEVAARDNDGAPVRCPTPFQDVYRTVAARHRCILIDTQAYFHKIGRHGLLDDSLFHDAMHPSLRGQIALAQAVLQGLKARRAFGWPEDVPAPVLDPRRCATQFGLDRHAWERLCQWGVMAYELLSPLHYDQARRRAKQDAFGKAHDRIEAGAAPEDAGLPNFGIPAPVPVVPDAAVLTNPGTAALRP